MSSGVALDSARQNLASSFVNSFVNAAFGADKLLTEDGNKWIYKNKEHGTTNENFYLSIEMCWCYHMPPVLGITLVPLTYFPPSFQHWAS